MTASRHGKTDMNVIYGIAVYFVIWWVTLFAILPWGVRTAHEAGEDVVAGQAGSAPHRPNLLKKVLWTTLVATVIFTILAVNHHYGWLTLDDLPGPYDSFHARPDFSRGT